MISIIKMIQSVLNCSSLISLLIEIIAMHAKLKQIYDN